MVYDVTIGKFGTFYVNPTNNGLDPIDSASLTPLTTKYHEDTPVMQFTGLKDKNGVEIYESDRLKDHSGYIWIVFWYNDHACFGVKSVENNVSSEIIDNENMEVIGNIYQNPELLKQ